MSKKTCKKCLKAKAISHFVKDKRNKDGTTNVCKACRNTALRRPPRRYIGKKEQECNMCHVIKPINEFQRSSYTKNGRLARCKSCKPKEPKPFKAYGRLKAKQKLYDIPIEITKEDVAMIFKMFEGRCAYCNALESDDTRTFELEHIIPMSDTTRSRHHASNLCVVCKDCNLKKHNKPLIKFYRSHESFTSEMLDFIFIYIAYFSDRTPEQVAQEFYVEVDDGIE